MAKIERKVQKIFGGNLSPAGNIAIYGTKEAGSPSFSDNVDTIQSLSWLQGILGATSPAKAPYIEDLNGVFYVITKQLAYLFQAGVAEWLSTTEYFANASICQHNGFLYRCISNNTNKEPGVAIDWETYWLKFDFETSIVPTGSMIPFAGTVAPQGWKLCDGSAISRSTYAKLFSIIGTAYGEGDGVTTFNLPDFRNRTFWGGDATNVGTVKEAGLPNIKGKDAMGWAGIYVGILNNASYRDGALQGEQLYSSSSGADSNVANTANDAHHPNQPLGIGFDASKYNAIYKDNINTVQPPAIQTPVIIKY